MMLACVGGLLLVALLGVAFLLGWRARGGAGGRGVGSVSGPMADPGVTGEGDAAPTTLYAHNLMLRKGPQFRVYVRWIRGLMVRTKKGVNPSFDDPESFVLEVQKGVIRANIGDISNFLNQGLPKGMPLTNVSIEPNGEQLKLKGTVHKIVPLPVELDGTIGATADRRVQFHVTKINVLKVPLKGLLGGFHVELADLVKGTMPPGVTIVDNDVFFDTERLLPAPHIRGAITTVRVRVPDLEVIYGGARDDETQLAKWHNFLRLSGGTLDFGKLTMHHVDLTMVDASRDPWFDLDLVNYQAQLVNGTTRMTAQAGLEIFMPDVDEATAPKKKAGQAITMEWLKDRSTTMPTDVPAK